MKSAISFKISMHAVFTYTCLVCRNIAQVVLTQQYNIDFINFHVERGHVPFVHKQKFQLRVFKTARASAW